MDLGDTGSDLGACLSSRPALAVVGARRAGVRLVLHFCVPAAGIQMVLWFVFAALALLLNVPRCGAN